MSQPASNRSAAAHSRAQWGLWLDRIIGLAAALILLGMMLLTTVDVISRYVFNWPLRGAFELTELSLLVLIFAGLPLVSRRGEHVTLDFIDRVLGERFTNLWRRVVEFVIGLVILGLAYQVWIKAGKIAGYGDTTDVLRVPVGPFVYMMAGMVALTGVIHVVRAFIGVREEASPTLFSDDVGRDGKTSP
jgi:TRAP-type C4-dicarboxylate transport system permease small subunit